MLKRLVISVGCQWLNLGWGFTFIKIGTHSCNYHTWAIQIEFMGFGVEVAILRKEIVEKLERQLLHHESNQSGDIQG